MKRLLVAPIAVLALALTLGATPAQAAPKTTAKPTKTSISEGAVFTVKGKVKTRKKVKRTVTLQIKQGKKWHKIRKVKTNAKGVYKIKGQTPNVTKNKKVKYRIVVAAKKSKKLKKSQRKKAVKKFTVKATPFKTKFKCDPTSHKPKDIASCVNAHIETYFSAAIDVLMAIEANPAHSKTMDKITESMFGPTTATDEEILALAPVMKPLLDLTYFNGSNRAGLIHTTLTSALLSTVVYSMFAPKGVNLENIVGFDPTWAKVAHVQAKDSSRNGNTVTVTERTKTRKDGDVTYSFTSGGEWYVDGGKYKLPIPEQIS